MKLPDQKTLGAGLQRWREYRGWLPEQIAANSTDRSSKSFKKQQVTRWERGEQSFDYTRLVADILPAYRVEDFDTFLDFCREPGLEDVTVIEAGSFTPSRIQAGTIDQYLHKPFLKTHRTRIDRVTFDKGLEQATPWGRHEGHEFVLVLTGTVKCEFSVTENLETSQIKSATLSTGMAVAFPSLLYHRFQNASDKEPAELVAARPANSGFADRKER